jgi:hypothetical protein
VTPRTGSGQHQRDREVHEQRMKFADERHKGLISAVTCWDSFRFAYTDQTDGGYIPTVVVMWSGNKADDDGVLRAGDASIL